MWALTLWGQSLAASRPNELVGTLHGRDWGPGLDATHLTADSLSPLSVLDDSPTAGERQTTVQDGAASPGTFGSRRVRWAGLRGR